jgi:hypothetical protein
VRLWFRLVGLAATVVVVAGSADAAQAVPFAPYVDETADDSFSLAGFASETGARELTLGFVVANGKRCEGSFGAAGLATRDRLARIRALRAMGGDVIVSFGGAGGTELAKRCHTAKALANQYDAAVKALGVKSVDFDIEGPTLNDRIGLDRRSRAIALLQRRRPGLEVSFTLPVDQRGLTGDGRALLRSALGQGVRIGVVNVMAMDFFNEAAVGHMGSSALEAARSTLKQLAKLMPSATPAQLAPRLGVTVMIGVNDDPKEIFTLDDAHTVGGYATSAGIGRLSMWSAKRDKPCAAGEDPGRTHEDCHGLRETPGAFSAYFASLG